MNEAACSWRTTTALILVECLRASRRLAAFSPAPPKAASTPTLSSPLTIASYTRIGRALRVPSGGLPGFWHSCCLSFAQRVVLQREQTILGRYREIECERSHTICDIALHHRHDREPYRAERQIEIERRSYILSRALSAAAFAETVRSHWVIENNLRRSLDATFNEDQSRLRTGHGAKMAQEDVQC